MLTAYIDRNFSQLSPVNQEPGALIPENVPFMEEMQQALFMVWLAVEYHTGYRWRCTSYIRNSPSHKYAASLDVAPDIAPSSLPQYSVTKGSDPVLYKRTRLVRALQTVAHDRTLFKLVHPYTVGIFIEPDHLHIQLFKGRTKKLPHPINVIKWRIVKPDYGDSCDRSQLDMLP